MKKNKTKGTGKQYREEKVFYGERNNTHGEAPRLVHCDYCGGTYVFGEIACPHCNAPGKTVCDGSAWQANV